MIPRIFPNPKCGKNGVGVLIWNAPPSQRFRAYCHNASGKSDLQPLHVAHLLWVSLNLGHLGPVGWATLSSHGSSRISHGFSKCPKTRLGDVKCPAEENVREGTAE